MYRTILSELTNALKSGLGVQVIGVDLLLHCPVIAFTVKALFEHQEVAEPIISIQVFFAALKSLSGEIESGNLGEHMLDCRLLPSPPDQFFKRISPFEELFIQSKKDMHESLIFIYVLPQSFVEFGVIHELFNNMPQSR
jgi:hypothetical protein